MSEGAAMVAGWLPGLVWPAAALAVGAMGFAIQRGGTCTVAAVDELLTQRRATRLLAMLEASLWVAGGLALAQLLHVAGSMPLASAVSARTVAGGVLLGIGAWLNRACVFGAVARLGNGEWAYAATPLGYYAGCLVALRLLPHAALPAATAWALPALLLGPPFVLYALWRLRPGMKIVRGADRRRRLARAVWHPHAATVVIGISFVAVLLLVGRWAYTDALADLAGAMGGSAGASSALLLAALVAGALLGGHTAASWRSTPPSLQQLAGCFGGGALMGCGSLLIPGSNDALVLIGMPLLQPSAWLAFGSMVAVIAAALLAERAWRRAQAAA